MQYKDISKPKQDSLIALQQFYHTHKEDLIVAKVEASFQDQTYFLLKTPDKKIKMYCKGPPHKGYRPNKLTQVSEIIRLEDEKAWYYIMKEEGKIILPADFKNYETQLILESI